MTKLERDEEESRLRLEADVQAAILAIYAQHCILPEFDKVRAWLVKNKQYTECTATESLCGYAVRTIWRKGKPR